MIDIEIVASYTDAWIEMLKLIKYFHQAQGRILHGCVD